MRRTRRIRSGGIFSGGRPADLEPLLGEEVQRQVDRQRVVGERRAADADEAVRAEELDLVDLGIEDVRVAGRDRAREHVLRAQVDLERAAADVVALRRCRQSKLLAPMRTRPSPSATAGSTLMRPDEVGDERRRRVAVDLQRRADLLDHALVHHDDAVGHRERLFLVVRHHHRRHAELALQRADLVAQVHAHDGVQRRQRLVEQQQPRRGGQRARQRDALLLPARHLRRVLGAAARQADKAEEPAGACAAGLGDSFAVDAGRRRRCRRR